mmetsp:Transcript_132291/g.300645  ORF Transcript_132291/g.300645 Transcript_132291/m.300645 type:complete len:450 (+) Transcript_132291:87-1436(+)
MSSPAELKDAVAVIPGRLYWLSVPRGRSVGNQASVFVFSTDRELVYENFNQDFGPLNLGLTYRYCKMLSSHMDAVSKSCKIIHCCSSSPADRANTAVLMALYMVIRHGKTPEEAWAPFANVQPGFAPYRDAVSGRCSYKMTAMDCLQGMAFAMQLGWFRYDAFNLDEYEKYGAIDGGDANWIVPGKFLAFTGPFPSSRDDDGCPAFTPQDYVPIFQKLGVGLVMRLNRKQYDRKKFIDAGIRHVDLYFPDGSCPPREIINTFLQVVEQETTAVAVHCKAGLGRTGTLIGLWCMKWHRFPARGFIAWNRMCRPGSILGPQQQFLNDMEQEMFRLGEEEQSRGGRQGGGSPQAGDGKDLVKLHKYYAKEDVGQAERLNAAKRGRNRVGSGQPASPASRASSRSGADELRANGAGLPSLARGRAIAGVTGALPSLVSERAMASKGTRPRVGW